MQIYDLNIILDLLYLFAILSLTLGIFLEFRINTVKYKHRKS